MKKVVAFLCALVLCASAIQAAFTVKIGGQSYTVQDGERVTISLWAWRYGYDGLLTISRDVHEEFVVAGLPNNWPLYVASMPNVETANELDGLIWDSLLLLLEADRLCQLAATDYHYLDSGRVSYIAAHNALIQVVDFYNFYSIDDLTITH